MERESDVQLVQKILSGDEAAFGVLVEKHQKSVHALAWRKVGDFHDAEEITQDTFLPPAWVKDIQLVVMYCSLNHNYIFGNSTDADLKFDFNFDGVAEYFGSGDRCKPALN